VKGGKQMFRRFFRRFRLWLLSLSDGHPVGVCSTCHKVVRERDGHYIYSRYAEDGIEEIDLYCSFACVPKMSCAS